MVGGVGPDDHESPCRGFRRIPLFLDRPAAATPTRIFVIARRRDSGIPSPGRAQCVIYFQRQGILTYRK